LSCAEFALIVHAPDSIAADDIALATDLTPPLLEDLRDWPAKAKASDAPEMHGLIPADLSATSARSFLRAAAKDLEKRPSPTIFQDDRRTKCIF
jgi:hypothetical protein